MMRFVSFWTTSLDEVGTERKWLQGKEGAMYGRSFGIINIVFAT